MRMGSRTPVQSAQQHSETLALKALNWKTLALKALNWKSVDGVECFSFQWTTHGMSWIATLIWEPLRQWWNIPCLSSLMLNRIHQDFCNDQDSTVKTLPKDLKIVALLIDSDYLKCLNWIPAPHCHPLPGSASLARHGTSFSTVATISTISERSESVAKHGPTRVTLTLIFCGPAQRTSLVRCEGHSICRFGRSQLISSTSCDVQTCSDLNCCIKDFLQVVRSCQIWDVSLQVLSSSGFGTHMKHLRLQWHEAAAIASHLESTNGKRRKEKDLTKVNWHQLTNSEPKRSTDGFQKPGKCFGGVFQEL